jgi:hypothetical protein
MLIPYGFVNNKAAEYITQERLAVLPTARGEEWWIPTPATGSGAGDPFR